MEYRPLPVPPAREPDHTAHEYGASLVHFLLQTRCTAVLSDDDLELASHVSVGLSGLTYAPETAQTVYARLSELRHLIAACLTGRKADRVPEPATCPASAPYRENAGPMAPLLDRPIVRPPSPSYAVPGQGQGGRRDDIAF